MAVFSLTPTLAATPRLASTLAPRLTLSFVIFPVIFPVPIPFEISFAIVFTPRLLGLSSLSNLDKRQRQFDSLPTGQLKAHQQNRWVCPVAPAPNPLACPTSLPRLTPPQARIISIGSINGYLCLPVA